MDKEKARELIIKHSEGRCTPEEIDQLYAWYGQYVRPGYLELPETEAKSQRRRIRARLVKRTAAATRRIYWKQIAAAAMIIMITGVIYFSYETGSERMPVDNTPLLADIAPGTNRALLTLADGRQVDLGAVPVGKLDLQIGLNASKTDEGQLIYSTPSIGGNDVTHLNRIETPRGGQFRIQLPDSTSVWLNAASSLEYFTTNHPGHERRVRLSGEAYFEVAKADGAPFTVVTAEQEIQVLGTHFNVSTYESDAITKTTLLEGRVRIHPTGKGAPVYLQPGQQALTTQGNTHVYAANTEEAVAWTKGYFMFDNEPIESIMRKIARWYDVTVEFREVNTQQVFSGTVSRFDHVSKVLEKLELTGGVNFEIETHGDSSKERRIIVMP